MVKQTLKFNGKRYTMAHGPYSLKMAANKKRSDLNRQGINARVVRRFGGYYIYTRG